MPYELLIGGALAILIVSVLTPISERSARRFGALRLPGGRHHHPRPISRWGGLAVLAAIGGATLLHPTLALTHDIVAVLIGMALLALVGAIDDRRELPWHILLSAQILASTILLLGGIRLAYLHGIFGEAIRLDTMTLTFRAPLCFREAPECTLPLLGSAVVLLWTVALINAFNWLDGTDGAATAVAMVSFGVLAALALQREVSQLPIAILATIGLAATSGFLPFTLPQAKVFLGTAGSFGVGFLIAALAILSGAKLATVGMVLLLPAADAAAVIIDRLRRNVPITSPDTRHLHHFLASYGWSPRRILVFYVATSILFGLSALILPRPEKILVLSGGFIVATTILLLMKQRGENH
jgi:UDP-GlcNAc:undecaprenyl-phosphate GlcNAc-1-phosphate transferase